MNARILSRILAFSGLPVALALGLFPLFYYLKARALCLCLALLHGTYCRMLAATGHHVRQAQSALVRGVCFAQVVQKVDLPMGLVYTVQSLIFGAGFLGISWGVLSASWDPQRKGGVFGVDEVKRNFPVLWQDLRKKG